MNLILFLRHSFSLKSNMDNRTCLDVCGAPKGDDGTWAGHVVNKMFLGYMDGLKRTFCPTAGTTAVVLHLEINGLLDLLHSLESTTIHLRRLSHGD